MNVLNMLNAKYFVSGESEYMQNPDANGNAWIVDEIAYVEDANAEMSALDSLDTKRKAVADKSFASVLGEAARKAPGDTIFETKYAPNRLNYRVHSAKGGVAVFSEIYFPWGWTATIDGKEAPIGRVNYVLRAIRVPAGDHNIQFEFDPESLRVTENVSIASIIAIYVLCAAAVAVRWRSGWCADARNSSGAGCNNGFCTHIVDLTEMKVIGNIAESYKRARHSRGFGVHSPFAFRIVNLLRLGRSWGFYAEQEIAERALSEGGRRLRRDALRFHRLCASFADGGIYVSPSSPRSVALAASLASSRLRITGCDKRLL